MPEKAPSRLLTHLRQHAIIYTMAALFTAIFFTLQVTKHNAFHSRIGDFARFSQAIWSVLDGKLLYTSMPGRSILGDHFSPIMALAAPFLLIWPDERVLFLVQAINVAATGVILTLIMYEKRPGVAPVFAFAFFMNANVHLFTLIDFRRIIFGLPWMALAMLGLTRKNRPMLLIGLLIALTAKESVSLYIAAIGLYLLLIERDWKWGIGLTFFGSAMLVLLSDVVIPAFAAVGDGSTTLSATGAYPQLFYYQYLGDSYGDIAITLLKDPFRLFEIIFDPARRLALLQLTLPLGFLLFLAPEFILIYAPFLLLMLLSGRPSVHSLSNHYTASLTPIIFTAVAVGWNRLPKRWDRWVSVWLIFTSLLAFFLFSSAPFGGHHKAFEYQIDDHDHAGNLLTKRVPEQISLYTQTHYTPHLTHVDDLHVHLAHQDDLPFSDERLAPVDYILIDRTLSQEPLGLLETELYAQNMLADPDLKIVEENDGIFLFQKATSDHPVLPINATYEQKIALDRVEIAVSDADGFYLPADSVSISPGQTLRVSLFWQALSDNIGERTVSVRLSAADGFLLAQQDHQPAEGVKPTSWWESGDRVRDVHYLMVPEGTAAQIGTIDLVLYDSFEGTILPSAETRTDILTLTPITITP